MNSSCVIPSAARNLALAAAMLCVAGCAAAPIEPPRFEVFSKMRTPAIEMPGPADLPERPKAMPAGQPSAPLMVFTTEGARQLIVRDEVCEINTKIAAHAAAGFADLQTSYGVLLHQAQLLESQHNYMAQRWAQAEDELRRSQREQLIENWVTRALFISIVIFEGTR